MQTVLKQSNFQVGFSNEVEYKSMKNAFDEQPSLKFKEFVAQVDPKRNRKNDSNVVFEANPNAFRDHTKQIIERKTQASNHSQRDSGAKIDFAELKNKIQRDL